VTEDHLAGFVDHSGFVHEPAAAHQHPNKVRLPHRIAVSWQSKMVEMAGGRSRPLQDGASGVVLNPPGRLGADEQGTFEVAASDGDVRLLNRAACSF